jgi:hypothetical protein
MSHIAFGFDHARLLEVLSGDGTFTKVVMSLCNLKRPSTGVTSMHIAAHFCDATGKPLESRFEVACPYPPGWSLEDHDPGHPGGAYVVKFEDLKGAPKFMIDRQELLTIVKENSFPDEPRKQLLATIEASNGSEPLKTFIRFITDPDEVSRVTGMATSKIALTFAV